MQAYSTALNDICSYWVYVSSFHASSILNILIPLLLSMSSWSFHAKKSFCDGEEMTSSPHCQNFVSIHRSNTTQLPSLAGAARNASGSGRLSILTNSLALSRSPWNLKKFSQSVMPQSQHALSPSLLRKFFSFTLQSCSARLCAYSQVLSSRQTVPKGDEFLTSLQDKKEVSLHHP